MKLPVTRSKVQVRFPDTDALGHISSGSYINYMEIGRADFFYKVAEQSDQVPYSAVVNINIDYIGEVLFGEEVSVVSWCSRMGGKSMTVSNEIYAGDRLAARGQATVCGFDTEARTSIAFPTDWQASDYPAAD